METITAGPDRRIPPAVHPMGRLEMPGVSTRVLPNGMTLNILDRGTDEVTRLSVLIRGGKAESPRPGVAQIAAAAALDGTRGHTAAEIADILDYNGAWGSCVVADHYRHFTFHMLNSRTADVMPVIAEVVAAPAFPAHEVAVEAEKAARQLELAMEKVTWHSRRAAFRIATGLDGSGGTEPTPGDLRAVTGAEAAQWHAATFSPRAVTLFLAGRVTPEVEHTVASAMGALGGAPEGVAAVAPVFVPSAGRLVKVERKGSLQTSVTCMLPVPGRRHADYVALRLAVMALGGYFGSRLMLNIREDKGYTYGIGASLLGFPDAGLVEIDTECDNRYTPAVLDEIKGELRRMHDPASYSGAEIERLRSFLTTSLAAQLDSPFAAMDYHITHLLAGTPRGYFDAQQDALEAMTPESLAASARRYLDPGALFIALAGD